MSSLDVHPVPLVPVILKVYTPYKLTVTLVDNALLGVKVAVPGPVSLVQEYVSECPLPASYVRSVATIAVALLLHTSLSAGAVMLGC